MPQSDTAPRVDPVRWLRYLKRAEFTRLMGTAIEATLRRRGLAEERAVALRQEALARFGGLLVARARRVRALTRAECLRELERSHGTLLRQREQALGELDGLARELTQARARQAESGLTPAEDSALAGALRADLEALLARPLPRAGIEVLLVRERRRRDAALGVALARERERIDLLERRLAKQRQALLEMEHALAELARRAELDAGLPSIYRSVQGLADGSAEREAKLEMLRSIYEQNLSLQRRSA